MRFRRLREHRRRYGRKPDRFAHQAAACLFEHKRQLGKAETKSVRRIRDENAKPAKLCSLTQP